MNTPIQTKSFKQRFPIKLKNNSITSSLLAGLLILITANLSAQPYWEASPSALPLWPSGIYKGSGSGKNVYFLDRGSSYNEYLNQVWRWNTCYGWQSIGIFGPGSVNDIEIFGNDLYVCGNFSSVSVGETVVYATNIAKCNLASGGWSVVGNNSLNRAAYCVTIDAQTNIYVGTMIDDSPNWPSSYTDTGAVLKWNGASWSGLSGGLYYENFLSHVPPCTTEGDSIVQDLATDGTNIFASGGFSGGYNGSTQVASHCIIKWDGSNWSAMDGVYSESADPDCGDLHGFSINEMPLAVVGTNVFIAGTFGNGLARFSTVTGNALSCPRLTIWETNSAPGYSLVVKDGILYVAGSFNKIGSLETQSVAQWNSATETWSALGSGVGGSTWPGDVRYVAANANAVYVASPYYGGFDHVGSIEVAYSIGRWVLSPDVGPCVDSDFAPVCDGGILDVALQSNGDILLLGDFSEINGAARGKLARLNTDGTLDYGFYPSSTVPDYLNDWAGCVAVDSVGRVYVGGGFSDYYYSIYGGRLIRLDSSGDLDQLVGTSNDFIYDYDNWVLTFAGDGHEMNANGFLTLGGAFDMGASSSKGMQDIAIGTTSGEGWIDAVYTGVGDNSAAILALKKTTNGIIAGGDLWSSYSLDNTFDQGIVWANYYGQPPFSAGADGYVYALATQADGKILAGGDFYSLGGLERQYIGRFNPNGTPDSTFASGAGGTVSTILVQSDGKILVGGSFGLSRLNANGTQDATFDIIANGVVNKLIMQPDGKVLAVGDFSQFGPLARNGVARFTP
jgi:uncharacterized delta-60 repeat protein